MTLTNQNKTKMGFYLFVLMLMFGCGDSSDQTQREAIDGITVVATTTMIEDLARQLVGDKANVVGIMKVGEDPHVYETRPNDAVTISKADLVLSNGFHLEATLDGVIHQAAQGKVVHLAEDAGIEPLGSQVYEGAPDPHCWMDVMLFKRYAQAALDALIEVDPENQSHYTERATAYFAELDRLDAWVKEQIDSVPQEQRLVVTSHDAFNYYAKAYSVEFHGVMGISTDGQIAAQNVERLRNTVKERGIRALFVETSVTPTLNAMVEKIAADTGAKIGGTLYSDSLGGPETKAGTYIGMIRHNTTTLVEALR